MNWVDYFLKFQNEEAWLEAAPSEWFFEGEVVGSESVAVDVVGVIYRDDTPEGQEPVARPGYHVNVRLRGVGIPESLAAFVIERPETPARVFA